MKAASSPSAKPRSVKPSSTSTKSTTDWGRLLDPSTEGAPTKEHPEARHDAMQLAQHVEVDARQLRELLTALARAVESFDEAQISSLLRQAVPELGVIQPGSVEAANVIAFNRSV